MEESGSSSKRRREEEKVEEVEKGKEGEGDHLAACEMETQWVFAEGESWKHFSKEEADKLETAFSKGEKTLLQAGKDYTSVFWGYNVHQDTECG